MKFLVILNIYKAGKNLTLVEIWLSMLLNVQECKEETKIENSQQNCQNSLFQHSNMFKTSNEYVQWICALLSRAKLWLVANTHEEKLWAVWQSAPFRPLVLLYVISLHHGSPAWWQFPPTPQQNTTLIHNCTSSHMFEHTALKHGPTVHWNIVFAANLGLATHQIDVIP